MRKRSYSVIGFHCCLYIITQLRLVTSPPTHVSYCLIIFFTSMSMSKIYNQLISHWQWRGNQLVRWLEFCIIYILCIYIYIICIYIYIYDICIFMSLPVHTQGSSSGVPFSQPFSTPQLPAQALERTERGTFWGAGSSGKRWSDRVWAGLETSNTRNWN